MIWLFALPFLQNWEGSMSKKYSKSYEIRYQDVDYTLAKEFIDEEPLERLEDQFME